MGDNQKRYSTVKQSYSGADFKIFAFFDIKHSRNAGEKGVKEEIIPLGNLQAITTSYSSSLSAVENMGSSMPAGFTRGQKTYAGTLVFTVINTDPLIKLLNLADDKGNKDLDALTISFDQIPPFNVLIEGASELPTKRGVPQVMTRVITGVKFMAGGETISIDDFFLEQQHQYVAQYISPWRNLDYVEKESKYEGGVGPLNLPDLL